MAVGQANLSSRDIMAYVIKKKGEHNERVRMDKEKIERILNETKGQAFVHYVV